MLIFHAHDISTHRNMECLVVIMENAKEKNAYDLNIFCNIFWYDLCSPNTVRRSNEWEP